MSSNVRGKRSIVMIIPRKIGFRDILKTPVNTKLVLVSGLETYFLVPSFPPLFSLQASPIAVIEAGGLHVGFCEFERAQPKPGE